MDSLTTAFWSTKYTVLTKTNFKRCLKLHFCFADNHKLETDKNIRTSEAQLEKCKATGQSVQIYNG